MKIMKTNYKQPLKDKQPIHKFNEQQNYYQTYGFGEREQAEKLTVI